VSDKALASRAADMRSAWEGFMAIPPRERSPETAFGLAAALRSMKEHVLDRLSAGEWLGWLFPSFVRHILEELDHFTRALGSAMGMSAPDKGREVCAVLGFMRDHAAFAAHLLDPSEVRKVREARALLGGLSSLAGACRSSLPGLIALSERAGKDLDAFLVASGAGTPKTKSIIHPVLAAHVVREGRMFLDMLRAWRME